jgi:Domain of unknown function (DUF4397)
MKINIKNLIIALAACCAVIWTACGDKALYDTASIAPDGARVKFFNAVTNTPKATDAIGQPFTIFLNDTKWSGLSTSVPYGNDSVTYASSFPLVDYSIVPGGTVSFKARPTSNKDTTVLINASLDLKAGKYYSVFAIDTFPSARVVALEDDRSVNKSPSKSYYRLVNAISGGPAAGYDLYMRRQSTSGPIATVKFGEASAYLEIDPNLSTVNDTIFIRPQGSTTTLGFLNLSTTNFTANRIRNIVLRGNASIGGTRGARTLAFSPILTN